VRVLLAVFPYLASLAVYLFNARDLFLNTRPPPHWTWRLSAPVMIAGLTPLALASKTSAVSSGEQNLLLLAPALGVMYAVLAFGRFREKDFLALHRPFTFFDREIKFLSRRRFWIGLGALVIAYAAAANIYVSA